MKPAEARFVVATHGDDHNCPLPDAVRQSYPITELRTVDDPAKITFGGCDLSAWWYSEGRNHRRVPAKSKQGDREWIARDKDVEGWVLDALHVLPAMFDAMDRGNTVTLYRIDAPAPTYLLDLDHECE